MAINQLNKYVWLVETIHRARNRGGITLKEIQSRWLDSELSEGTALSRRTSIHTLHAVKHITTDIVGVRSIIYHILTFLECLQKVRMDVKLIILLGIITIVRDEYDVVAAHRLDDIL